MKFIIGPSSLTAPWGVCVRFSFLKFVQTFYAIKIPEDFLQNKKSMSQHIIRGRLSLEKMEEDFTFRGSNGIFFQTDIEIGEIYGIWEANSSLVNPR